MAKRQMPQKEVSKPIAPKLPVVEGPIHLVVANCHILNLRAKPARDAKVLKTLPVGTIVVVDKLIDEWLHVIEFGDETQKSKESVPGYILAVYTKEV